MPRQPRFIHPVRHVRTCLGHTQSSFAKVLGCSAVAIQRIENGTLPLSSKLANLMMEATGANPAALLRGEALDLHGKPYTKAAFENFKALGSCIDNSKHYRQSLFAWIELLLTASERAGQDKTNAVFTSIQSVLKKVAADFNLQKNINGILIERGAVRQRAYRVSDLRKFPAYAKILRFKDNRRHKPNTIIPFEFPTKWIPGYALLHEVPVLPKELEKKHKDTVYIIDFNRPVPKEIQDVVAQARYWKIKQFHLQFGDKPAA